MNWFTDALKRVADTVDKMDDPAPVEPNPPAYKPPSDVAGVVITNDSFNNAPKVTTLSDTDYEWAAQELNCEVETIRAVVSVEAGGSGFRPDGFPKILFEGHKFHKYTKGMFDVKYPHISYPKWTRVYYGTTWQKEDARYRLALSLNRDAANMSTSWGAPQIMGANYSHCDCATMNEFLILMNRSARDQLELFVSFIKNSGLADEMQRNDFANFARLYNGPGQVPVYSARLRAAYNKFKS